MQTLIVDLTHSLDEPQDSANLQIAVLSFFNAVINYKAGRVRHSMHSHLFAAVCCGARRSADGVIEMLIKELLIYFSLVLL